MEIWGYKMKETEKAVMINASVKWGEGKVVRKDLWIPKSAIDREDWMYKMDGTPDTDTCKVFFVADWLTQRLERENAFKGYAMKFVFAS